MGKVLSIVSKSIKNYNVENRAHKIISKEKPAPAPKHKADIDEYERILKDYPQVMEDIKSKHKDLDERLKNVFVVAHDPALEQQRKQTNPDRPLPLDRTTPGDFEYGVKEPDKVLPGRATLRNVLKFINDHQTYPRVHTVSKISDEYLLPENTVSNILKYYKVFELYIPEKLDAKTKFFGPKVMRHTLEIKKRKQITEGSKDNT